MRRNPAGRRLPRSKPRAIRAGGNGGRRAATASRPTGRRSGRSQGAEKQSPLARSGRPYRKPTQVGGMRNLRRTRELALRNSAKCARNFGRSAAASGLEISRRRRHKAVPGDCLPKTQASANQQWEVWGLTPARCRKVKGSGQPQGEAANRSPGKRRP